MNLKDREAVERAKQNNPGTQRHQPKSKESALEAKAILTEKISPARRTVADAVKAEIIGGGISDALYEISIGDFGDVGNSVIESLDAFMDEVDSDRLILEGEEIVFLPLPEAVNTPSTFRAYAEAFAGEPLAVG